MENLILLNAEPSALAQHLQDSAARLGTNAVTEELLSRVDSGSLPPRFFSLWLAASGDCEAVCQGLRFQHSRAVRRASITRFGKLFRSSRLHDIWNAIGGTAGTLEYLATAPVCDVKSFCNQIRRSATTEISATARVALVDDLYDALRRINVSGAALTSPDRRPLASLHHSILPACSQKLVLSVVDTNSGILSAETGEAAFFAQTAVFRSRCVSQIQDPSHGVDMQKIRALLRVGSKDSGSLQDPGVSGNSQFALEVLEAFSTRREVKGDARAILSEIATPLFRRLARRQCLPNTLIRATLAYVAFWQNHISSRMTLKELCKNAGASIIERWGRRPESLEDSLVILLRLAPSQHLPKGGEWLTLVELVPRPLRIRLLGAVCHCDLTTNNGVEQSRLQWYGPVLLALPRAGARQILERLIQSGSAGLNEHYLADRRHAEITLLRIKLAQGDPDLLQLATAAVDEQKNEAGRARDRAHRGLCVSYALQFAAASRRFELYREVLLWTRKYIRDPPTAMEIFRGPSFTSDDCLGLLCGFSETRHGHASTTKDHVAVDVMQANVIISECVETVCLAQLEPGFKARHWRVLLGLMSAVVIRRYQHANALQDALQLSDDEMFEAVWRDTLETCRALEILGLDKDNTSLEFNELGGPLKQTGFSLPELIAPRPATLRFLDTLAKTRNSLWEEYRRMQCPATLTLPQSYPRGLPLECLVPIDLRNCQAGLNLPYLLSRAEDIVFVSGDAALTSLPKSHDEVDAIRTFVENWPYALKLFVGLSAARQEAALAAWKHAIGPLSASRLSAREAHIFWSPVFSDWLSHTDLNGPWEEPPEEPRSPRIPVVEDDEQLTEWSPETGVNSFEIRSRRLEVTRIDVMLDALVYRTMNTSSWPDPFPEVPSYSLPPFWSRWKRPRAVSTATREALVAAAILHISEANLLSPGILSKPFPSKRDPRFPALYLDGDFLDRENPKDREVFVWDTLAKLSNDAPTMLLVQLTECLIETSAKGTDRLPAHALRLLRVLIKGDRPQAALHLVHELVLNRPEDSSWQRLLLNEGLLNSLPKPIVEQFLKRLVAAIQERLLEQFRAKDNDTAVRTSPRVKVTTVKMLAQLLSGAMFVDSPFACSVLTGLLANSRHIDIRVSVVETLLDILTKSRDEVISNGIISAFEMHVVPLMSGVNERAPMSKEEWNFCDATHLPELYNEQQHSLPPLISCFISSVAKVNEGIRKQLFGRIILPTFFENAANNGRWTRMFLESHGFGPEPLPNSPTTLQFLVKLMEWPAYIPASVIDMWLQIVSAAIQPPSRLMLMNRLVSKDTKLRDSSNGRHWLSTWGAEGRATLLNNTTKPSAMLSQDWQTVRSDGLSVAHVQSAVLQQLELMLPVLGSAMKDGSWTSLINDLKPPAWYSKGLGRWHRNVKPVLQQVMDKVETLRTSEWQHDANRFPATLPNIFLWRLWLVTPLIASEITRNQEIKAFAASVSDLLLEICHSARSYFKRYEAIASFIKTSGTATDKINLALAFGNLAGVNTEQIDAAHDLKIDLARQLLQSELHTRPKEELCREVNTMVRELARSSDEDTRGVGLSLLQDTGSRSSAKAWYAERAGHEDGGSAST